LTPLQVTFCKRKGGLFKKADDLSKLCGCEVGVLIIAEGSKALHFASSNTEINRVSPPHPALLSNNCRENSRVTVPARGNIPKSDVSRLSQVLNNYATLMLGQVPSEVRQPQPLQLHCTVAWHLVRQS